ncbi:tRNA (adenine(37)-N6)-methyltransferase isoform X2 [Gossypium hirsutum]|uniref:tRNA (Adenine(37)-N6)-methyltransferase isoform X2 n=1 Tax=Gossypium hirsutum TaxID=3635 RepID=A0ABM2YIK1_GOSHI|nr:tRNA (adenine(37)-N6)-methyltransferase isoform X2 [Gossypium hirsutum]
MSSTRYSILALALASLFSASSAISFYIWRKNLIEWDSKLKELKKSLNSALEKCASERQGRIRAQQALRKAVVAQPQAKSENLDIPSYPMAPIDLEKLWKHPSKSKFKAKVRVPRLKGGRMGVFATRSPHRLCPIGLTVAKVEAVQGNMVLLSGVDLVDGTPVLDIKPYLPYCDSIEGAVVPNWVMLDSMLSVASVGFSDDFSSSLLDCWKSVEKKSLYSSPDELKSLVKQALSWDIRSVSQRNRPHNNLLKIGSGDASDNASDLDDSQDGEASGELIYYLILDGMDFSYKIDGNGDVMVKEVHLSSAISFGNNKKRCNFLMWKDKIK